MTIKTSIALVAALAVPGVATAANANHPYANVDHRIDAGNNTGDARVDQLNAAQLAGPGLTPAPFRLPPPSAQPPARNEAAVRPPAAPGVAGPGYPVAGYPPPIPYPPVAYAAPYPYAVYPAPVLLYPRPYYYGRPYFYGRPFYPPY